MHSSGLPRTDVHLLLASRTDPDLPLARLRVRGHLGEVRTTELRFTREETQQFLIQRMGLALSEADATLLEARTEGWIASLQLAALFLQKQTDLSTSVHLLSGNQRFLLDYLREEVLAGLPEDVQDFLLQTSVLPQLSVSLCNAIRGREDSDRLLEQVERANLFLQPLDERRQWYRYHAIWAQAMQHEAPRRLGGTAAVQGLHRKASQWYEQQRLLPEAIEAALRGEDFSRATTLIKRFVAPNSFRNEYHLLRSWLEHLPEEIVRTQPDLCSLFVLATMFTLLFGGQTISVLGNALYMVALPWLILTTGGSAQELGIVLSAYGIPLALCTLAGGWISDRLRPRRLMLIADTVRMLLVGILAALALSGHPAFWEFCAIAVPLGILGGVFTPASMAMVPDTLSPDDLQAGNGLMMASMQGGNLVGSSVAGVVVSMFTAGTALAIDAATFLVSAASLALIHGTKRPAPDTSKAEASQEHPVALTKEQGVQVSFWEFLRTSRLIQVCLLLFIASSLVTGGLSEVALPALIHGPMHGNASNFGFITAGWGAGALAGSIIAGIFGKSKRKGLIVFLGGLLMAAMIALIPVVGLWGAIACMLIGGLCSSGFAVLLFTEIQLRVPDHLMGRIMGLLMFSVQGLYPISTALAGVLAIHFGPVLLFPLGGLILAVVMLFAITQKAVREI